MILQIRGTSGSGKSTVVKQILEQYTTDEPQHVFRKGRRNPLYSIHNDLAVVGHYATDCGGGDTVGAAKAITQVIEQIVQTEAGAKHILVEGLLLSEDSKWTIHMSQWMPVKMLFLSTTLPECQKRVLARRKAAGTDRPYNYRKLIVRNPVIRNARTRLLEKGFVCKFCTTEQAPVIGLQWLRNEDAQ